MIHNSYSLHVNLKCIYQNPANKYNVPLPVQSQENDALLFSMEKSRHEAWSEVSLQLPSTHFLLTICRKT